MKARFALVALVVACGAPDLSPEDRSALDSVEVAWVQAGLPDPEDCFDRVVVKRHDDYDDFKAECRNPFATVDDPRVLIGCTTSAFSKVPWRGIQYTAHIAPGNPDEYRTVQHEGCHILEMCTGLHDDGDPLHADTRVWDGGVCSPAKAAR